MQGPSIISEELGELYKEQMRLAKKIAAKTQEQAHETVKDYALTNSAGETVALSSLFGERSRLIVIHNMGFSCSYCTLWADTINGTQYWYEKEGISIALTSPNSVEDQAKGASKRGWTFDMYSLADDPSFAVDMGYSDGKYFHPGASLFEKDEDGTIRRVGATFFGPGDSHVGVFHFLGMFPGGIVNDYDI